MSVVLNHVAFAGSVPIKRSLAAGDAVLQAFQRENVIQFGLGIEDVGDAVLDANARRAIEENLVLRGHVPWSSRPSRSRGWRRISFPGLNSHLGALSQFVARAAA